LAGYQQLAGIDQALLQIPDTNDTAYLQLLRQRVEQVLTKNRIEATDLQAAHDWLVQITHCLHYPSTTHPAPQDRQTLNSQTVRQAIETLLAQFHPTGLGQSAQRSLYSALKKRWSLYAQDLLHCYDIPGLPQDNLRLESLFGRLRRHQRRLSGRRSTRELQDFGQIQVLFHAQSQADLLLQLKQVPYSKYCLHRQRLALAEAPRQFFRSLHHDPAITIQTLLSKHADRCLSLHKNLS
jgi:hypothetical protein